MNFARGLFLVLILAGSACGGASDSANPGIGQGGTSAGVAQGAGLLPEASGQVLPANQAANPTPGFQPSGAVVSGGLSPETLAYSTAPAPARVSEGDPPPVTAPFVAIVDEDSGAMLYSQQPEVRVPIASTTKIATTLVALEREPDLQRVIPITIDGGAMAAADGSQVMGLEPGEQLHLETLLYGMMLWSGNDAAEQVAVGLADGSRDRYVGWMNQLAASLGLRNTHFANPSGMDADGHYSSASDMAYLARFAMRDANFRRLAGSRLFEGEGYILPNINRLLAAYPGADGVKIGYTDDAQRTMIASATRDGHRVFVSFMRSADLVGDATTLLDWVWRTFRW
ncbi:MAG: D-alanyl-D-alanine carboxypeptidase [Chloroflexi bacterium]|nr:D-alanyl-D-alanine carboxypeptidase [Chloroflexota bacterium]